jgi:protein disulfide-isomerase A6
MAQAFDDASEYFSTVLFGGANCVSDNKVCDGWPVDGYPTIVFFQANSSQPTTYRGERSARDFVDFIENQTGIKGKLPIDPTVPVDPRKWLQLLNSTHPSLVLFQLSYFQRSRRFLPAFRQIARIFLSDANITAGSVDCERFRNFCESSNVTTYPVLFLVSNGTMIQYDGPLHVPGVVEFVNQHCGTRRRPDGLLTDDVGLIPEAELIVPEFLTSDDKSGFVSKLRAITGADFYVKVVERYLTKGKEETEKDILSLGQMLAERSGSANAIDRMKERWNVMIRFAPHLAPTPSPDPVVVEDDGEEDPVQAEPYDDYDDYY